MTLEQNYRSTGPILALANAVIAGAGEGFRKHLWTDEPGVSAPPWPPVPTSEPRPTRSAARCSSTTRPASPCGTRPSCSAPATTATCWRSSSAGAGSRSSSTGGSGSSRRPTSATCWPCSAGPEPVGRAGLDPRPPPGPGGPVPPRRRPSASGSGCGEPDRGGPGPAGRLLRRPVALWWGPRGGGRPHRLAGALDACRDGTLPAGAQVETLGGALEPLVRHRYDHPEARLADFDALARIAAESPSASPVRGRPDARPTRLTGDLAGAPSLDDDWLTLSTVHSAKGGEWGVVHVIHAADGAFPSDMATGDADGVDEERRLFYVALTRARRHLHLYAPLRYHHGDPAGRTDRHSYALRYPVPPPGGGRAARPAGRPRGRRRRPAGGERAAGRSGPGRARGPLVAPAGRPRRRLTVSPTEESRP